MANFSACTAIPGVLCNILVSTGPDFTRHLTWHGGFLFHVFHVANNGEQAGGMCFLCFAQFSLETVHQVTTALDHERQVT